MVSYNHHQPGISVTELHKNFPLTFSDKMEKAPVSKYLRNIVIKFFLHLHSPLHRCTDFI